MRICFIMDIDIRQRSAHPALELKQCGALCRLGHEVVFVASKDDGLSEPDAQTEFRAALERAAVQESFSFVRIPRPTVRGRLRRSFYLLAALWARAQRFDICWCRDVYPADFTTMLGMPTIAEVHAFLLTKKQLAAARRMMDRNNFKLFVVSSEAHKQALKHQGLDGRKLLPAHNAVDLKQFEFVANQQDLRRELGLPGGNMVLYSGSLYQGRGIEELLQAAKVLEEVWFVFVGGRDFEVTHYRAEAETLGLRNVLFLGYVPNARVPQYLLAADILVAPYTEDCRAIDGTRTIATASPLKLFEYMGAGKPIIISNIGAIPEVIKHEHNGLLITPGSADDLVSGIRRLLTDSQLAQRLGAAAREDVKRYTWEARASRILTFAGLG